MFAASYFAKSYFSGFYFLPNSETEIVDSFPYRPIMMPRRR